jgi:23S rRNA (cytosine1962-C5)-methyltransferase
VTSVKALLDSAARRAAMPIPPATDVLRLADGEPDHCGPLLLDRYGDVLRLEVRAQKWPKLDARQLAQALKASSVVGVLRPSGAEAEVKVLFGDVPELHVVTEAGARYAVRCADEDAAGAGIFVDHRDGRRFVRAHSRGALVMNTFAHAGAFGVAAATGGATRVDHVDAAKKCAPWAALNLALNGCDPRAHKFIVDDAIDVLSRSAKKRAGYDLIILDPPTTAVRPNKKRFHVEKDLPALVDDAIASLADGGNLLVSSNDRSLRARDLIDLVRARFEIIDEIPTPPDVPSAPMRGVFCRSLKR